MENLVVRLVSEGERLLVGPCDGRRTIAQATNVFSYIDPYFKHWGTDVVVVKATPETPVAVYEMEENADFIRMFTSLNSDVSKLVLTQDQILDFIEKHRNQLSKGGWVTFFLFQKNNEFFVALVDVRSYGRLEVRVYRFGYDCVWFAEYRHRLVVPSLR